MAKCIECGAETRLYVEGFPLCVRCDTPSQSTGPVHWTRQQSAGAPFTGDRLEANLATASWNVIQLTLA